MNNLNGGGYMSAKIQIGICDDEDMILRVIAGSVRDILTQKECIGEIDRFSSAKGLLRALEKKKYALLFLDIDMPDMDGITLAKKIRAKYQELDIIFVSNREDRVFDAFSVHPFGFVRKSMFLKDIASVFEEWLKKEGNISRTISLQVPGEGMILLPIKDIVYIEGSKKDQIVHMNKQDTVVVRSTMDFLEEKLREEGFIRCHKGFLVNCGFISLIRFELVIEMRTGEQIPVGRARLRQVKEEFLAWFENNGMTVIE